MGEEALATEERGFEAVKNSNCNSFRSFRIFRIRIVEEIEGGRQDGEGSENAVEEEVAGSVTVTNTAGV